MQTYLVLQHGKCRIDNEKLTLFPLPPGVKVIFLTPPGRKTISTYVKHLLNGKPTHFDLSKRVYNKPGVSFVPDLELSHDYVGLLGHTWKYNTRTRNVTLSQNNLMYVNNNVRKIINSNKILPAMKQFQLKLIHTRLSKLISRLGPGTYIVGSCRKIGKEGIPNRPGTQNNNNRKEARILQSLDNHGGNLNKVIQEIPDLQNHIKFSQILTLS